MAIETGSNTQSVFLSSSHPPGRKEVESHDVPFRVSRLAIGVLQNRMTTQRGEQNEAVGRVERRTPPRGVTEPYLLYFMAQLALQPGPNRHAAIGATTE